LLAGNVFRRPKANVLITIDGVTKDDKFDVPGKAASYPVAEVSGNYFYRAKLSILVENYHKFDER